MIHPDTLADAAWKRVLIKDETDYYYKAYKFLCSISKRHPDSLSPGQLRWLKTLNTDLGDSVP
jgi:hypothetical protein